VRQKARDFFDITSPSYPFFGNQAEDFTESDTENSYELGLKHAFNNNWNAYGRIGRSVRFGTVDELFELNDSFVQIFSRLKPQTSRDIEVGVNFNKNGLHSALSVFHQQISDEIHFNPSSFQNVNLDHTEHNGLEFSVNTQLNERFSLKGGYTYLNAEFVAGANKGNEIPLVPEHSYNVSLQADFPLDISAGVNWNYISASRFANDLSNTFSKKIPSYQTVDLKVSKKISALELALQVNNVFDEEYYNFAVNSTNPATPGRFNAYSLPERNAYLSVTYTFK